MANQGIVPVCQLSCPGNVTPATNKLQRRPGDSFDHCYPGLAQRSEQAQACVYSFEMKITERGSKMYAILKKETEEQKQKAWLS